MNPSTPLSSGAEGRTASVDGGAAALWASAFVILGLILVQAGHRGGNAALAGQVAEVGALKILTTDAGSNEEVLAVLNQTDDVLMVYAVEGGRSVELYQQTPLAELFTQARGAAGAAPRGPGGKR